VPAEKTIVYDASRLLSRATANTPTGIDRVNLNYLLHFINNPEYRLICIALKKGNARCLDENTVGDLLHKLAAMWQPNNIWAAEKQSISNYVSLQKNEKLYVSKSPVGRTLFTGHFLELAKNRQERYIYINVAHQGINDEAFLWALKHNLGCEVISFIHDLIPITHPEYTREGETARHVDRINGALNFSKLVIVNSNHTQKEVLQYAREKGLPQPKVIPLYIGVEPLDLSGAENEPYDINLAGQDYFVVLGTIEPRKNHLLLLNIWRSFVEEGIENIPKLVVIGKRGWCNENIIDMLDRCEKTKPHVVELSDISDHQLVQLLKGSKGLLFPSFVEGWGMPLIEALSLKVPVICSDLDVFRESGKDLPTFIDPLDANSWKKTILQAAHESISTKEVPELPSWEAHFRILDLEINQLESEKAAEYALRPIRFDTGFIQQLKISLIAFLLRVVPEKTVRKFLKFKRTPVQSMVDTRFKPIQKLGKFLAKG